MLISHEILFAFLLIPFRQNSFLFRIQFPISFFVFIVKPLFIKCSYFKF